MQPTRTSEDHPINRLSGETSPYLRQHAHNPVDWYPWGPEALEKARSEDKPIFLSIGYSACHWCHVMERESFENEEVASFLNLHYVSIKVDREERPDLDDLYMSAVQLLGAQGGWPLSVWLTPDLKPFFGGTYFPPDDRYGRPGFLRLLRRLLEVVQLERAKVDESASAIVRHIALLADLPAQTAPPSPAPIRAAAETLLGSFDRIHGGFGGAPRFPQATGLQLLLRHFRRSGDPHALRAVERTCEAMAHGGLYDQLGGGFHRYSTDVQWLVPHFEKMLYDQALLSAAYLEAWLVTGHPLYARVVRETLDYVLREMTSPEGGFTSTQDADSEGEEGRFYLWTRGEIRELLGQERADLFCRAYGVEEAVGSAGGSILYQTEPWDDLARAAGLEESTLQEALGSSRALLLRARERRVRPFRDEKVLTSWNGLVIAALAQAGWALEEERFLEAARRAAESILARKSQHGRLTHAYKDGQARPESFLEDYAAMIGGLVALHQATFDPRWLTEAAELAEVMIRDFADEERGGFFDASAGQSDLFARLKSAQDGSTPSGNSLAAHALLRLGRLLGRTDLWDAGERTLRAFFPLLAQAPGAFPQMLLALDLCLGPTQDVVVFGPASHPSTRALIQVLRERFSPETLLWWSEGEPADSAPLAAGKRMLGGRPTAWVCSGSTCLPPVTEAAELAEQLDRRSREGSHQAPSSGATAPTSGA